MQDHIEVAKHCGRNEILRCADSIFGSKYGPAKWCRFGSKSRASDRKNFAAARRCSTPQRRVSACCQDMDCATQTSSQLNPNVITTLLSLRLNAKPIALIVSSHYGTATKITKKGRTQTHTRPYTQVRAATQHHAETRDPPARIPEITWRNCNPMSAAWNQPTNDPKTFRKIVWHTFPKSQPSNSSKNCFFRPTQGSRQVVYPAAKTIAFCKFTELKQWQCVVPIFG